MSKFNCQQIKTKKCQLKGDKTLNDRYYLKLITSCTNKKTLIIIMKNPSSTGISKLFYKNIPFQSLNDVDKTTSHIINKFYKKYYRLIILNIFPYFTSNPKCLDQVYCLNNNLTLNKSFKKNLEEIKSILNKYNKYKPDLLLAWGDKKTKKKNYKTAIKEVIKIIKNSGIKKVKYKANKIIASKYIRNLKYDLKCIHGSKI